MRHTSRRRSIHRRRPLRRRSLRGHSGNTGRAVALLGGVAIATIALLMMGGARADLPRLADGCLKQGSLPAVELALIDATEPFPRSDAAKMVNAIASRAEELPVEGRLALMVLQPGRGGERTRELFARCRPRDGSDADPFIESPSLIARTYEDAFHRPLTNTLEGLKAMGGADSSPILEALYEAGSAFERPAGRKHLLVVSDMLEFSLLNMYRSYRWEDVARHPRVAAMGGRLEGVEVTVLLRLHPNRRLQAGRHSAFWQAYFRHAGVRTLHIRPL